MKAFLIDSKSRKVTEIEYSGDWRDISKTLGCGAFDVVRVAPDLSIFVDDEGLLTLTAESTFFKLKDYPSPLAGNGLVLGLNPNDGDSVAADRTLEQVEEMVEEYLDIFEVQARYA